MESLPNRFCVVCTSPLDLEALEQHRRYKARKCVDCKAGKRVADIPHCVHCRAALPNQRRESWACRPLCLEGEAAKGLESMKATPCKCEICRKRRDFRGYGRMHLCTPRPTEEREKSKESTAGVDIIPEMGILRDEDSPRACRYVYEARPVVSTTQEPAPKEGSVFERIEAARKKAQLG